jgi:putative restriction endonuclease
VANPSVFGEIHGYPEGSVFDSREALRAAGLHRHGQAGISGAVEDGADAIMCLVATPTTATRATG